MESNIHCAARTSATVARNTRTPNLLAMMLRNNWSLERWPPGLRGNWSSGIRANVHSGMPHSGRREFGTTARRPAWNPAEASH
eukprot:11413403-Alexandrium_andersonii.AAC.1